MNLSDYILLSQEQRKAHLDLSLPCEFGINRHWSHRRDELLEFFNVVNDCENWAKGGIHRCHACQNDTQSERVCLNPRHWWIGTAHENSLSRPLEKRQAGGRAVRGVPKSPESVLKRAEALRGQKRSAEQKKRISDAHKGKFFWITNGFKSIQHPINFPIPEGWKKGRTLFKSTK